MSCVPFIALFYFFFVFESCLSNGKQRVVIDGQSSKWEEIEAGVPKGSILGPCFFLYMLICIMMYMAHVVSLRVTNFLTVY